MFSFANAPSGAGKGREVPASSDGIDAMEALGAFSGTVLQRPCWNGFRTYLVRAMGAELPDLQAFGESSCGEWDTTNWSRADKIMMWTGVCRMGGTRQLARCERKSHPITIVFDRNGGRSRPS